MTGRISEMTGKMPVLPWTNALSQPFQLLQVPFQVHLPEVRFSLFQVTVQQSFSYAGVAAYRFTAKTAEIAE